jgi:hypothetical protein
MKTALIALFLALAAAVVLTACSDPHDDSHTPDRQDPNGSDPFGNL